MGITVKSISEMFGKEVFTNKGAYVGRVSDLKLHLGKFRIHSILLDVDRRSPLASMIGSKKGLIIPYQYVDNIGDVVIIKHITAPVPEDMPAGAAGQESVSTGLPF